jgi:hypothetical protein
LGGWGGEPEGKYRFFFSTERGTQITKFGQAFFEHKRTKSVAEKTEFVSDRTSYKTLRVRWFPVIFLGVPAPTED